MPKLIAQHGRRVGAKKEASREECHKPREKTIRSQLKASLRGSFQRSTSQEWAAFVHLANQKSILNPFALKIDRRLPICKGHLLHIRNLVFN
ncbi:hypothetical protein TCAL_15120 [Tigriopus californicus]|uniref:Uncharacterized protein n=1 Tax=Tigriopus californicus TaxID=6832 RepID=A0A553NTR7_TIGCA|nr:hypothetical protein TCAL_15120 [Tigriopus californicus]